MKLCARIVELMLEAEPEALAGVGDDPVATHVRSCPACAQRGQVILEQHTDLDAFLGQSPPLLDVDGLLEQVLGPADAKPDPGLEPSPNAGPNVIRFPSWRRWAVTAAAAAVAGLLLLRGDAPSPEAPGITQPAPPLLEAASGQNVAVMATANPDITVLWFYD